VASHPLLFLGAVVLVGGVVVGAGLWAIGAARTIDAARNVQGVSPVGQSTTNICAGARSSPACYVYGYGDSEGVTYIGPGDLYVATFTSYPGNGSAIVELQAPNLRELGETSVPCMLPSPPQYPGTGPYVFLPCATGRNAEVEIYNWSSGAIVGSVPTPTADPNDIQVAEDPDFATAYAAVGVPGTTGYLLTIDLSTATIVANVSLPALGGLPFVWASGRSDSVIVSALGGSYLLSINPLNGLRGEGVNLGGSVRNFGADATPGSVEVCFAPDNSSGSARFEDFSAETLEPRFAVTTFESSSATGPTYFADGTHGDLYVYWSDSFPEGQVLAVNETTGAVAGAFTIPAHLLLVDAQMTYDPRSDTLTWAGQPVQDNESVFPLLGSVALSHESLRQASFSAFPLVGAELPEAVTALALAIGGAMIVASWARNAGGSRAPKAAATSSSTPNTESAPKNSPP
jgi:hypothetical protein